MIRFRNYVIVFILKFCIYRNVDQFVKAYHKYGLDKYSKYLSERNELNSVTSPSIDMGKAPYLFSNRDSVSQQIYHVPNWVYPHFVWIKYHEICPYFKFRNEKNTQIHASTS